MLRDHLRHLPRRTKLSVLDLGPGVGALTTLFAVRELAGLGLLEKLEVSLTLLDVSAEVLEYCKSGKFHIPEELRDEFFAGLDLDKYRYLLSCADTLVGDGSVMSLSGQFDVILSGFALHHMNNEGRRNAIRNICGALAPGGFLGIVDESLTYSQYLEYLANHLSDEVRVAQESFVQDVEELADLFVGAGAEVKHVKRDRFYCIWGVKNQKELGMEEQARRKPAVVIFSSTEGLDVANRVQQLLQQDVDAIVWNQGVFVLGSSTIESLERAMSNYDFGIFVFTPDDKLQKRNETVAVARDNVLFELGLFVGKLSRSRAFVIRPIQGLSLASDLMGLTVAVYDPQQKSLTAALGPACQQIRDAIKEANGMV